MITVIDLFAHALPWVYAIVALSVVAGTVIALRLMRFTDNDDES